MKKSVLILALAAVCLLSACQKENKSVAGPDSTIEQPNPGQQNPVQPDKVETDHDTRTESLFELTEYDGVPEITLEWGDRQSPAKFHKAPLLPLGLYLPDQMEVYEFEDGNKWGYDGGKHFISINDYDEIYLMDLTLQNKELGKYKEYVGSKLEGTVAMDGFIVEKDQKKYFVELIYFTNEQANALPMFVEVARHIRHVPD
ncbi:hypothetical protein YSY43_19760 [Paenibacillus sp. YSY-4.3]